MPHWTAYLPRGIRPSTIDHWEQLSSKQKLRTTISYACDWVITIVIWVVFIKIDKIDGFKRQFSLTDTSIQHTFATSERVPVKMLVIYVFVVPIVIFFVVSVGFRRSLFDFHASLIGIVLAQAITWTATTAFKVTAGRPRPDLIDRCQPTSGAVDALVGLSNASICTRTDLLKDGFRSFPSGHSSSSFAGLGFLAFYIAAKLHLFDKTGYSAAAWLAVTPFVGAVLIAISRTMDYRHHPTDVIAGGVLGTVVAYTCYRLYFPSLSSKRSHEPYWDRLILLSDAVGDNEPDEGSLDELPLHNSQRSPGLHHVPTDNSYEEHPLH